MLKFEVEQVLSYQDESSLTLWPNLRGTAFVHSFCSLTDGKHGCQQNKNEKLNFKGIKYML